MITKIRIQNFKSISDLTFKPGRVTVLTGENGSGKSNLLEAIAFGAAATLDKVDNEFLVNRGVRTTEPELVVSRFAADPSSVVLINLDANRRENHIALYRSEGKWEHNCGVDDFFLPQWLLFTESSDIRPSKEQIKAIRIQAQKEVDDRRVEFCIFSPEHTHLRTFQREGGIQPLGVKGEGLFRFLKQLSVIDLQNGNQASQPAGQPAALDQIKENLRIVDWFGDLTVPSNSAPFEQTLQLKDRYLHESLAPFDQRSSNEGFLFLLFYFTLFIGPGTPKFFAIDNVDASLSPNLCRELMQSLVALAKEHDKQVLITTHNPALLEGLNLHDDEQKLFVVSRTQDGSTGIQQVGPPLLMRSAGPGPEERTVILSRG